MRYLWIGIAFGALVACGGPDTSATEQAATSTPGAATQTCPAAYPLVFYFETETCQGTHWTPVDPVAMPWAPIITMRSLSAPDGCRVLVPVQLAAQVRAL